MSGGRSPPRWSPAESTRPPFVHREAVRAVPASVPAGWIGAVTEPGVAPQWQEQLSLPGLARAEARRAKPPKEKPPVRPAAVDPVAQVLVDVPLAHLDRPFDYLVPDTMADDAVPGARVKVRFAGQDVDGFVPRPRRRVRPSGSTDAAAPRREPRAGAHARDRRTHRRDRRPLGGHPLRRAPARRPAPPRHHREQAEPDTAPGLPAARPHPLGAVRRGSRAAGRPRRGRVATRGLVLPAR